MVVAHYFSGTCTVIVSFLKVQLFLNMGVPYSAVAIDLISSEGDGDPGNIPHTFCSTTFIKYLILYIV
jgi:hypothetical protein